MSRAPVRVRAVLGVAVGALVVLQWLDPNVPAPGSLSWEAVDIWYRAVGPNMASLVAVRAAAIAASLWLIVACALQVTSATAVGRIVGPLADRVAPAALRGLAGASLSAALMTANPMVAGAVGEPGTATMHPLSDDEVTTSTTRPSPPTSPVAPALPAVPVLAAPRALDAYTVSRSESFWTIAADRMTEVLRRPPADAEVRTYWVQLIEANRARLVDPGNADLLYAGQVLVLPPVG